jgi:hypothetical protein
LLWWQGNIVPVLFKSLACGTIFVCLAIFVVSCSTQPKSANAPDPAIVLQSIPPADPASYERIEDMKKWRNPYIIIRMDSVALLDSADSAEIILKTDELLPALAHLPSSKWPYGRIVAAAESGTGAGEQEGIAIRRNKGIVGGILESAHIAVKWVPAA